MSTHLRPSFISNVLFIIIKCQEKNKDSHSSILSPLHPLARWDKPNTSNGYVYMCVDSLTMKNDPCNKYIEIIRFND